MGTRSPTYLSPLGAFAPSPRTGASALIRPVLELPKTNYGATGVSLTLPNSTTRTSSLTRRTVTPVRSEATVPSKGYYQSQVAGTPMNHTSTGTGDSKPSDEFQSDENLAGPNSNSKTGNHIDFKSSTPGFTLATQNTGSVFVTPKPQNFPSPRRFRSPPPHEGVDKFDINAAVRGAATSGSGPSNDNISNAGGLKLDWTSIDKAATEATLNMRTRPGPLLRFRPLSDIARSPQFSPRPIKFFRGSPS